MGCFLSLVFATLPAYGDTCGFVETFSVTVAGVDWTGGNTG